MPCTAPIPGAGRLPLPTDSALPTRVPSLPGGETSRTQPTPRRSPKGPSISSGRDEQDARFTLGSVQRLRRSRGCGTVRVALEPGEAPQSSPPGQTRARRPPAVPKVGPRRSAPLWDQRGEACPLAALRVQGSVSRTVSSDRAPDRKGPWSWCRGQRQPHWLSQGTRLAPLSLVCLQKPHQGPPHHLQWESKPEIRH